MLLTAIAALPTTPPGTLELLAESASTRTRLALLSNPNTPAGTVDDEHQPISAHDLHDAVTDPATTPATRDRILRSSATDTAWHLLNTYPDLTPAEVTSLAEAAGDRLARTDITGTPDDPTLRPLPWRAEAIARNPSTPHELATAMLDTCRTGDLSPLRHDVLAAITLERGVDPGFRTGSQFADAYLVTREHNSALTWRTYLANGCFPRYDGSEFLRAIAATTHDPEVASAVLARATLAGEDATRLIAGNFFLPESTRLQAHIEALDSFRWSPGGPAAYARLSDQSVLELCAAAEAAPPTSHAARNLASHDIVTRALTNPQRDPDTLAALVPATATFDNEARRRAIALHPNCPSGLRADLTTLLQQSAPGATTTSDAATRAVHAIHARPDGILDVAVSDLALLRYLSYEPSTYAHLVSALTSQECTLTESALQALVLLDETDYAGTVRELLFTANAIAS